MPLARPQLWLCWLLVAACVYVLMSAVYVIGGGFRAVTGPQAEALFNFASSPMVAVAVGIVATVLLHSSSTVTAIVVGLAAGGMPMSTCIPVLIGANIGTTATASLVALAMLNNSGRFRRGFSVALIHALFNLFAAAVFLPLELLSGFMDRVTGSLASWMYGSTGGIPAVVVGGIGNIVGDAVRPLARLIDAAATDVWPQGAGVIDIVVGAGLILAVINLLAALLRFAMVGRAKAAVDWAIGRGPISGICSGILTTMMVQSSTTTTSVVVPLAGSGAFSLKQAYPYIIGANIGTTVTALIAALAFTEPPSQLALQAALVHVLFNVLGATVIYGVPVMRQLLAALALRLGEACAEAKPLAVVWLLSVYLLGPLLIIALSAVL